MADWKVIADKIVSFPHPGADKLMLGKVGSFQVVVGKSNEYQNDDIVIFAPEKSILPNEIKGNYCNTDTGLSYLSGPDHNRVKRVRLRGEYSEGVTLSREWVVSKLGLNSINDIPLNEDLSEKLDIKKFEPPIPFNMAGQLERIEGISFQRQHDVEQFRLYNSELVEGEDVIVTEKVHGSQFVIIRNVEGKWYVTSKGIGKDGLAIVESEGNLYWQALKNSSLMDLDIFTKDTVNEYQIFGEVIPCQKGYSYGQTKATVKVFRFLVNGQDYTFGEASIFLGKENMVPVLYEGPYSVDKMVELSKGMETLSGKQAHIREGVVVAPAVPRQSKEGFMLLLKVINPRYKDSEESFS